MLTVTYLFNYNANSNNTKLDFTYLSVAFVRSDCYHWDREEKTETEQIRLKGKPLEVPDLIIYQVE